MQGSLNTATGGGTQSTTQNPQSATQDSSLTANASNLQSGSINLLTGTNGVTLNPTSLPSVALQSSTVTTKPAAPISTSKPHHVNGILLAIVIAVFLAAMATFWKTTIAAKSTTE